MVKTLAVAQAMDKKVNFFELMCVRRLSEIWAELKKYYDPVGPTTYNDLVVFTQLDMDLISLQAKVKFWEMD